MPRSFLVKQQEKVGEKESDQERPTTSSCQDASVPSLPPPLLKVSPRTSKSHSSMVAMERPIPHLFPRPSTESNFELIKDENKSSFYPVMTSHLIERSSKEVWMYPRMHLYDDYIGARHVGHKGLYYTGMRDELMAAKHNEPRYQLHQHSFHKKPLIEPYNPYHVILHEPIRYPHALYGSIGGNIGFYGGKESTTYNSLTLLPEYYAPAIHGNIESSGFCNKDDVRNQEVRDDVKEGKEREHGMKTTTATTTSTATLETTTSPDSTQTGQETVKSETSNSSSTASISPPSSPDEENGEIQPPQQQKQQPDQPQQPPKPAAKKYRYTCDICGKSFSRSNTLTTHKRIHSGSKPFICEQCGRAFRQPGNLTRHRLTHTAIKPYVCPQCNKAFNRASNLHTHMRTHTNYKPFVCDFCGKGFHQKIDMKIHRYTHTGEKPHRCNKCGRGFKQLTHLTYHMRTHSDERLYKCEYCGKGFNQKGNLQAHIYGHTGERPFKCDICGKGFTLASTLNTHKRTHATKKPFDCQFCGKAFYQKNALKTHYIASHPFANGISLL